jgi:hypothetical protein
VKLTVKNGNPEFPKPDKELVKLAARYRRLLLARALLEYGSKAPPDGPEYENVSNELERISNALWEETWKRLEMLSEHYQLNDRGGLALALALAKNFVPNFDVFTTPTKSGRKRSGDEKFGFRFVFEVETVAKRHDGRITDACLHLSRRGQPWHGFKPGTLETRYYKEKRKFQEMEKALQNYRRLLAEGLSKPDG